MMMEDYNGGSSPIGYCGGSSWDDYDYEPRYGSGKTTTTTSKDDEEPAPYIGEYGDPEKIEHNL